MNSIHHFQFFIILSLSFIAISLSFPFQVTDQLQYDNLQMTSSEFSTSLETLQKRIGYEFKNVNLLRRAMTHASYSGENNKALSDLGLDVIKTSIALNCLKKDIDISVRDLNSQITKVTEVNTCAIEGTRLGLQNIIRVPMKGNSSAPPVVCSGFRGLFGAIAVDTGKADDAGNVFWNVHRGISSTFLF
ncbi:hypothetical protein MKW98_021818 [Papaver atlanticum]|uniref:RNase III domain-containing protein n=1 Tax=Papaver atlanticum TaxID=357466 RepID=A0AAD4S3H8_9MAGN|nr:hypothetical protein MKW98_021818 [Papaver atlanticum]